MAELLVIRHGQASFGAADYDALSPLGHRQAEAVGAILQQAGWVPDRVLTGTLARQRDTLTSMGLEPGDEHPGFNEYDFHDLLMNRFDGNPPLDVMQDRKTHFRTLRDTVFAWQADEIAGAAESWGDFTARVEAARLAATVEGARRVLVVSSGGVIGQLIASTLGAPARMMMELNLQVKNASIHRFVFSRGRMMLAGFNETPFADDAPELLSYS